MPTLAEALRSYADKLINLPTQAQKFLVNPTGVLDVVTNKTNLPEQKGFAEAFYNLPKQENLSVLDPKDSAYSSGYESGEPFGIAASAAPIAYGLAKNPQMVARAASPLYRPQVTTEVAVTPSKTLLNASGNPQAVELSRQRYAAAAEPSLLKDVTERQGYWMGESNPLFVAKTGRTLNVGKNEKLLKDVAQTAENLEQAGAAVTRVTPLPWGDLSKGNAAILTRNGKPLTNDDIKALNNILGESTDAVVQHRADGSALLLKGGWNDDTTLQSIVNKAQNEMGGLKIRPALSTEGIDRKYFERPEYQSLGAKPRETTRKGQLTQQFDEMLKAKGYRD